MAFLWPKTAFYLSKYTKTAKAGLTMYMSPAWGNARWGVQQVEQSIFGKHVSCLRNYLAVSICLSFKERGRQPFCVMRLARGSFSLCLFISKKIAGWRAILNISMTTPGIRASNLNTHTWDLTSVQRAILSPPWSSKWPVPNRFSLHFTTLIHKINHNVIF